ncbi:hypothetical protein Cs7R123_49130 [Catellatospora sp. TT07R-123]|uniref:hypothetical protein n=1 Tax=Catellatospora sp. TT07R-123 TaxID=2733863 RepID=UPI001B07F18C|nr:hypothetical protein [Catellatospora sp. TT07R-123]GHJ47571.1 hypothetical protein Cs7R123_49130 [Catellatospora sp. TT07R-123]
MKHQLRKIAITAALGLAIAGSYAAANTARTGGDPGRITPVNFYDTSPVPPAESSPTPSPSPSA